MKIETRTDRLWAAHTPDPMRRFFEPEDAERREIEALIKRAEEGILRDALLYGPEIVGESCFIFWEAPFTVLVTDPAKLPPYPLISMEPEGFKAASEWFEKGSEPWGGGGIVESLIIYHSENPEHQPFTTLGWWTDGEVGGFFGMIKGSNLITVLFG